MGPEEACDLLLQRFLLLYHGRIFLALPVGEFVVDRPWVGFHVALHPSSGPRHNRAPHGTFSPGPPSPSFRRARSHRAAMRWARDNGSPSRRL